MVSSIKKSKKVLLIDAFSTLHVGNGALIDNTYKLCKKYIGDDVEILSIDAKTNEGRFPVVMEDVLTGYGGSSLNKLRYAISLFAFFLAETLNCYMFKGRLRLPWTKRFKNFQEAVKRAQICVSLSGETINDHYMPHMYLRLLTYHLAILRGRKFLVFPQSIGPVFRPFSKWLLRKVLGKADFIIARDNESFALAKDLWSGCKVEILFCPDVAVTQESVPERLPVRLQSKKVVGITVSDIPKKEMGFDGDYLNEFLNGVGDGLDSKEYQILLMPSNYSNIDVSRDYHVCLKAKSLLEEMNFDVSILDNDVYHPDIFQGMQKNLYAFISTRMHVGILATSAGVPTLMINTQHKIRSYMMLMGMEDFVVELDSMGDIPKRLRMLLDDNESIRARLIANNVVLRGKVESTMLKLARSLD